MMPLQLKSVLRFSGIACAFFVFACNPGKRQKEITVREADSVIIFRQFPGEGLEQPGRVLSLSVIEKFQEDIHRAMPVGQIKFYPSYNIIVYKKDQFPRRFRANGIYLKEQGDECLEMPEKEYFDRLWVASGKK